MANPQMERDPNEVEQDLKSRLRAHFDPYKEFRGNWEKSGLTWTCFNDIWKRFPRMMIIEMTLMIFKIAFITVQVILTVIFT